MKKQRKMGKIAVIILISIVGLNFVFLNIFFFRHLFSEFLNELFLMLLYAAIPGVPAVILRAKFGLDALKWIALAATIFAALCFITHIILPEEILKGEIILPDDADLLLIKMDERIFAHNNEWIFVFTQFALTSSVPALYCIAFAGKGRAILAALAPSFMFFMSLLIRYVAVHGLLNTFEFATDNSIFMLMLISVVYAVWALLLIFVSLMIYMFISRLKTKSKLHKKTA